MYILREILISNICYHLSALPIRGIDLRGFQAWRKFLLLDENVLGRLKSFFRFIRK